MQPPPGSGFGAIARLEEVSRLAWLRETVLDCYNVMLVACHDVKVRTRNRHHGNGTEITIVLEIRSRREG